LLLWLLHFLFTFLYPFVFQHPSSPSWLLTLALSVRVWPWATASLAQPKVSKPSKPRVKEWQPHALVVGVPCHPDGNPHAMTARAQRFARQLAGRFSLPVHEVDERYSSVEAASQGAKDLDAESARIILEQFLRDIP
jgi:putative transcription antitermination factor YqgF